MNLKAKGTLGFRKREVASIDRSELSNIFDGSQYAIGDMERLFAEHRKIKTVVVNPDTWVGKELLIQGRRLSDVRDDVNSLTASVRRLEMKIDKLLDEK